MKISQTNCFFLKIGKGDIDYSLKGLHDSGFKYVDVSFFFHANENRELFLSDDYVKVIEAYKNGFEKYDLVPVQCHEPAGNSIGDDNGDFYFRKAFRTMEIAAKVGCPSFTVHPGNINNGVLTREEFIERNGINLRRLGKEAEKYGIKVLVENIGFGYPFQGYYSITANDLVDLIDAANHPLVAANLDVGHANINGQNIYRAITKLGSKLQGVHIHDNIGFNYTMNSQNSVIQNGDMHRSPLFYNVDFDEVMKGLIEVGYKGTFNLEDDGTTGLKFIEGRDDLREMYYNMYVEYNKCSRMASEIILKKYNLLED